MSKNKNACGRSRLSMTAVIVCDDLAFRANAAETLERVGRQEKVNVQWKKIFWPINALHEEALAKKALVDALDAHLILFPARCARSLPRWVFDWLNQWAMLRTIGDAALAVMADENAADVKELRPLLSFARRHGLSLIIDRHRPSVVHARVFSDQTSNPANRSFGINE